MLNFTLTSDGCGRLYDALTCLARFSETVTIEAHSTQLVLTALNLSKSAYVKFAFDRAEFFTVYEYTPESNQRGSGSSYSLLNKALSSVFKGRLVDPKQRDHALAKCVVRVDDRPDQTAFRFKIRMVYIHGVTKSYELTYEAVEPVHALFDRNRATNRWKIQAKLLREYIEYFAPKTEQLDIHPEEGRCTLLSFTEKITRGKETLKQPLQTAVSIDMTDFVEFNAAENQHIVINVKDFRNMVIHAESLKTNVAAAYSQPGRPLQFSYSSGGLQCEFVLMTIGEPFNPSAVVGSRAITREPQTSNGSAPTSGATSFASRLNSEMPPPQRVLSRTNTETTKRLGSRPESQSFGSRMEPDPDSLFLPDDDEQHWEPVENEHSGDMLGWDASAGTEENVPFHGTFRDSGSVPVSRQNLSNNATDSGVAPTQRASQVRGLFD